MVSQYLIRCSIALCYTIALPYYRAASCFASPVSPPPGGRPPASADPVAAMWRMLKSLVANEMSKVNEKIEAIYKKLINFA